MVKIPKKPSNKKRVNLALDPLILGYIDNFADVNGISRSGAISVIVANHRQSNEGLASIIELMQMVKNGADESEIAAKEKEAKE